MIEEMEDPFDYKKPEFIVQKEREERSEKREKRLGRKVGSWGGRRPGAGRKKLRPWTHSVQLVLTPVQEKVLKEMGDGKLAVGIEKLISEHM